MEDEGSERTRRECSGRRATRGGSWCACCGATRAPASRSRPAARPATSPTRPGSTQAADAYFLAMPHGIAATYASRLRETRPEAVVIDLSGDLRLPTAESYKQWYGHDHKAPHLIGEAVFGLCEAYRGSPPRRPARVEPGLLRHLGAAAAHPAPPRGPHRPVRHRRGRQERRHRRRPHAARGPPLLRARRGLLGLLAGPHAPSRGRDRGGPGRPHRPARRADLLPAPAAGEARDPDRPLREAEGRRRRAEARAQGRLRRHGLRPRDGRRSAAPVGRGRDERLPDLGARGRPRPRRRLLRPRQPREGRGGTGHPEPEPRDGLAGDGRPRLGLRPLGGHSDFGGQARVAS